MMPYASPVVGEISYPQPATAERTQPQNSSEEHVPEYDCDEADNLLNGLELFYIETLIGSE